MSKVNDLGGLVLSLVLVGGWSAIAAAADPQVPEKTVPENADIQPRVGTVQDVPAAATSVKEWLAQIEAATVQVTVVKLETTDTGLDITLETPDGKPLQVDATKFRAEGNSLIADIPNAVLALPDSPGFSAENPTTDIATVQVVQQDVNIIRVSVAGSNALPKTEVTLKTGGLAYSLNPEGDDADEEIVVTGEGRGTYRVPNASTATRTDTPIRDIPQSIQVVPQEVLRDRNVRTLTEAVETVSGVVDGGGFYGAPAGGRIIRGFDVGFNGDTSSFRNGFRDSNYGDLVGIGTVEQVEVLKGPGSVLFGQVEPGGIINTVTKQPLNQPYYKIGFEAGNYGLFQPSIDFSGPLDSNQNVLYRFIASYQGSRNVQPFFEPQTTTIAPSLTFNLGDKTKLNLYYEYVRYFASNIRTDAVVLSDGKLTPRDFYVGYPSHGKSQV